MFNKCRVCGARINPEEKVCDSCRQELILAADGFCDLSQRHGFDVDVLGYDDGYNIVAAAVVECTALSPLSAACEVILRAARRPWPAVAAPCVAVSDEACTGCRNPLDFIKFSD